MVGAAVIILMIAAAFLQMGGRAYLVLRDGDTGKVYASYPVSEGERFSVGFIHSVNKSPLTDVYEIRDHRIYVVETVYYAFGAGVQTQLEEGQTLRHGEDGSMIVSGFDREMTHLSYIVGTVSDHTLTIDGQEISLRALCGRNSTVEFSCVTKRF